jgi:hypothetical protein
MSPPATGAGLRDAALRVEALADAFEAVPELAAAAPQLRTGADRLRAGSDILGDTPTPPKVKKARRW